MARKKEPDQLSKDSTAALRAGMSYGKWKALQWEKAGMPAIRKQQEVDPEANTICRYCGKGFYAKFKHKRVFCSEECRANHSNLKARERRG